MQIVILVSIFLTGICGSSVSNDVLMEKFEELKQSYDSEIKALKQTYDFKIEKLDSEMLELKSRLAAEYSSSFFSVQLSENKIVAHNGSVLFDKIIVNYGGHYIQSGGIYIAPVDGYYMFTLVVREDGNARCAGSVMRTPASDPNNAVMLCRAEEGYYDLQTGSCTVIADLLAGDQVFILADGFFADIESESSYYMADGYTSLTGLLLRAGLE